MSDTSSPIFLSRIRFKPDATVFISVFYYFLQFVIYLFLLQYYSSFVLLLVIITVIVSLQSFSSLVSVLLVQLAVPSLEQISYYSYLSTHIHTSYLGILSLFIYILGQKAYPFMQHVLSSSCAVFYIIPVVQSCIRILFIVFVLCKTVKMYIVQNLYIYSRAIVV